MQYPYRTNDTTIKIALCMYYLFSFASCSDLFARGRAKFSFEERRRWKNVYGALFTSSRIYVCVFYYREDERATRRFRIRMGRWPYQFNDSPESCSVPYLGYFYDRGIFWDARKKITHCTTLYVLYIYLVRISGTYVARKMQIFWIAFNVSRHLAYERNNAQIILLFFRTIKLESNISRTNDFSVFQHALVQICRRWRDRTGVSR
jgi:hypothetical protein